MLKKQHDNSPVIPFVEITEVAIRETIRSNPNIKKSRESYTIPMSMIRIREEWNARTVQPGQTREEWIVQERIEELALGLIASQDEIDPSRGDFSVDGETFILSDGERRYFARQWLLDNGHTHFLNKKPIDMVEVLQNPKGMTELARLKQVHSTNRNKKLSPMQESRWVCDMKEQMAKDGLPNTSEAIAAEIGGVSRQWVDNYLNLQKLSPEDQAELESGTLKVSHAVTKVRAKDKEAIIPSPATVVDADAPPAETVTQTSILDTLTDEEKLELYQKTKQDPLDEEIPGDKSQESFKPLPYDKDSVHDQEAEATKPASGKYKEPSRPKDDEGEDALGSIDFKKEKTEAEMNMNECIKMVDKIRTKLDPDKLPKHQEQWANDLIGFLIFIQGKMQETISIIKKAADKR